MAGSEPAAPTVLFACIAASVPLGGCGAITRFRPVSWCCRQSSFRKGRFWVFGLDEGLLGKDYRDAIRAMSYERRFHSELRIRIVPGLLA